MRTPVPTSPAARARSLGVPALRRPGGRVVCGPAARVRSAGWSAARVSSEGLPVGRVPAQSAGLLVRGWGAGLAALGWPVALLDSRAPAQLAGAPVRGPCAAGRLVRGGCRLGVCSSHGPLRSRRACWSATRVSSVGLLLPRIASRVSPRGCSSHGPLAQSAGCWSAGLGPLVAAGPWVGCWGWGCWSVGRVLGLGLLVRGSGAAAGVGGSWGGPRGRAASPTTPVPPAVPPPR
jgi:hypothetical protein